MNSRRRKRPVIYRSVKYCFPDRDLNQTEFIAFAGFLKRDNTTWPLILYFTP